MFEETYLETVPCDYCGGTKNSVVMVLDGWQLVRCSQCGLIYVNPRPRVDHILQWYQDQENKGWSDHYREFYREKFHVDKDLFQEYVSRVRSYKTSGRFLDVGCGNGASLCAARDAGFDAYGVELGEWAQEWADQYALNIMEGTLENSAFPDKHFDVVFSKSFMEHVYSPSSVLKEMRRILKDDGLLVCAGVPNFDCFTIKLGRDLFSGNVPPSHLYYFQTSTLVRMIEKAGFRCVAVRSWGLPNDFLAGLLGKQASKDSITPTTISRPRTGMKAIAYRWGRSLFNSVLNWFKIGAVTDVYAWKSSTG